MRIRVPDSAHLVPGTKYRFRLAEDLRLSFPEFDFGRHRFVDQDGTEWLSLQGHALSIRKGYEWDGSSPKLTRIGPVWLGTPDFKETLVASLVHDALYQFINVPCFPLNRKQCDEIFLHTMVNSGFKLACVYYRAVRMLGGIFAARGDKSLRCRGH